MSVEKITLELKPGDRVRLSSGLVRTIKSVRTNGTENYRGEQLYEVMYAEGRSDGWSAGNSAAAGSRWEVVA